MSDRCAPPCAHERPLSAALPARADPKDRSTKSAPECEIMSKIPKTLTKISHMNHDVLRFTWISEDLFADFRLRDKE